MTSGLFYFDGDPYAVFVNGNGTIDKIVRGAVLALLAHGRRTGALPDKAS